MFCKHRYERTEKIENRKKIMTQIVQRDSENSIPKVSATNFYSQEPRVVPKESSRVNMSASTTVNWRTYSMEDVVTATLLKLGSRSWVIGQQ